MIDVTVRVDLSASRDLLNTLRGGLGDRAISSTLNKTATQAKTQMSQAIRQEFNISAALVRDRLRIRRASKRDIYTFTAALIGNPETGGAKRSMNLIHFLERRTSLAEARRRRKLGTVSQLHFKVRKSGGKQVLPGAFIGNKGRTVFIRTGNARLPIKAVRTIGVPQMFTATRNITKVTVWIERNLPRIAAAEFAYYLSTVRK